MEPLKIGTKVEILTSNPYVKKGNIGRITKDDGSDYLICFDSNCNQNHTCAGGHAWWVSPDNCKPIQQKKLMTVE